MSKPLKPQVIIAIIAAALLMVFLIGYNNVKATSAPERTDAAHRDIIASMARAREASHKGAKP
ncbi:hypothetical protein CCAX7_45030 [Capsulimonas corticalis]|uniref:Uncharacterized protein n=1 Tax=Capsulimonas corticalis TaxID=2219043 RepID=A0A402D6J0_9BACT|nr:hypothetical protein [Capsulimonas corticalis]BDI32452.1 hypothetical protein CCAX7_45030 [Capsulimonas corticalis]